MCHQTSGTGCKANCAAIGHMVAGILWFLALLSLVGAWISTFQGELFGFEASLWYSNVVALSLLGLLSALNGALFHGGKSDCCQEEKEGGHGGNCGCGEEKK